MNDGVVEELEIPLTDMYVQEFYLHCFNVLQMSKNLFVESNEGYTYVSSYIVEDVTEKAMTFIHPNEMANWFVKVRRNMGKIKIDTLDDEDMDYIEFDTLM